MLQCVLTLKRIQSIAILCSDSLTDLAHLAEEEHVEVKIWAVAAAWADLEAAAWVVAEEEDKIKIGHSLS